MDINKIRSDFPILSTKIKKNPLIYLDNAATMQVPLQVLNAVNEHYASSYANVHRGIHTLSERSTSALEEVRKKTAEFIGAEYAEEIIFTSGTTESINIAARSFAQAFSNPADIFVATEMEHHSNLIPWQQASALHDSGFRVIPLTDEGELDLNAFYRILEEQPIMVAFTLVSNVLGTVNPAREIIKAAHSAGAAVLVDAAQAMRHAPIDVRELDCDFLCFSGHKMMAPGGTGVLYGKHELLESMPPVLFGGGMVDHVKKQSATFGDIPFRFEAGTPNIAGIIGLGAAIDYMVSVGTDEIYEREAMLTAYCEEKLSDLKNAEILGKPAKRSGAVSFNLKGFHCYDTAKLLDQLGIAVRSGHHCAEPLLNRYGLEGAVRVSPAFYNTTEEIDSLTAGLERISSILS